MRVAHIIKVTRISGAERHLLVLLKGLRDQSIDAQLIILVEPDTPMDDMLAEAKAADIPIHRLVIYRDYDVKAKNKQENLPYGTNSAVSLRMCSGTASKSSSSVDSSALDSAAVHSSSLEHHIVLC